MKSSTRTIVRIVNIDKRKWTDTLRPKGEESDYNGWIDVIGNGHRVPGLQMASKVFIIICDVELGKPYILLEYPGRDPARANDGIEGKGTSKKRMSICNRSNRGSKFALTRNGADLLSGISLYAWRQTCECE